MKSRLLLIALLITFSGWSQLESRRKKIQIKAVPDKLAKKKADVATTPTVVPAFKLNTPKARTSDDIIFQSMPQIPKIGDIPDKQYEAPRNPSELYTDRFNNQLKEEGVSPELFNRDMDLGKAIVFTKTIELANRDYGLIDGDNIRVWLNGVLVNPSIILRDDFQKFTVELNPGMNIIEIEALNYGELSPNTGQYNFYDANGTLFSQKYWNLGIGFKARLQVEYVEKMDQSNATPKK